MSQGLTKEQLEEGTQFDPTYDSHGLITAVVTDISNGDLLMVAHMNETALQLTIDTGVAHFWSRSRQKLWKKGESSGNFLHVREMHLSKVQVPPAIQAEKVVSIVVLLKMETVQNF